MASLTPLTTSRFLLEGNISKETVSTLVDSGWKVLSASKEKALVIDFSMVMHADSAALAMLLEWMKRAQAVSRTVELACFPEELRALSSVCGLDQVFTISAE